MIISHSHRFVFIHNPKAAGSSIRKALLPYNTSELELWHQRYIPSLDRIVDMSHLCALDIPHVLDVPPGFFRFGFLRNPYSRFFSAVREHARQNSRDLSSTPELINEFVLRELNPVTVRFHWQFSHFCPQHYYFYSGNTLTADYLGRQETLKEDWVKILSILGFPLEMSELSNERQYSADSESAPYSWKITDLSEEAVARINQLYVKDWFYFDHYFTEKMVGGLPSGTHRDNVHNIRDFASRLTFYGEPPGLSAPEKLGFLTTRVEELEKALSVYSSKDHG
jgi:hypothetical protein